MDRYLNLLQTHATSIAVYLLVATVVGAALGLRKGQILRGALFGALLGPIGWFLSTRWAKRGEACPECGGINAGHPVKCRHCGINIRTAAQRSARSRLRGHSDGWR